MTEFFLAASMGRMVTVSWLNSSACLSLVRGGGRAESAFAPSPSVC